MTHGLDKITNPNVARSVAVWHDIVANKDLRRLASIVHPDAVFRSPFVYTPYSSRPAVVLVLSTVTQVFQDFKYHRELATPDGLSVVLEFSASINGKNLKGIDLIRFDEEGQIVDFEVMVRPRTGLEALGNEMGKRLGSSLPAYKDKGKL